MPAKIATAVVCDARAVPVCPGSEQRYRAVIGCLESSGASTVQNRHFVSLPCRSVICRTVPVGSASYELICPAGAAQDRLLRRSWFSSGVQSHWWW